MVAFMTGTTESHTVSDAHSQFVNISVGNQMVCYEMLARTADATDIAIAVKNSLAPKPIGIGGTPYLVGMGDTAFPHRIGGSLKAGRCFRLPFFAFGASARMPLHSGLAFVREYLTRLLFCFVGRGTSERAETAFGRATERLPAYLTHFLGASPTPVKIAGILLTDALRLAAHDMPTSGNAFWRAAGTVTMGKTSGHITGLPADTAGDGCHLSHSKAPFGRAFLLREQPRLTRRGHEKAPSLVIYRPSAIQV